MLFWGRGTVTPLGAGSHYAVCWAAQKARVHLPPCSNTSMRFGSSGRLLSQICFSKCLYSVSTSAVSFYCKNLAPTFNQCCWIHCSRWKHAPLGGTGGASEKSRIWRPNLFPSPPLFTSLSGSHSPGWFLWNSFWDIPPSSCREWPIPL